MLLLPLLVTGYMVFWSVGALLLSMSPIVYSISLGFEVVMLPMTGGYLGRIAASLLYEAADGNAVGAGVPSSVTH